MNVISEQRSKLEQFSHECDVKSKLIDDLQSKVVKLSVKLDSMKVSLNDIEQYGRRNSLRFTNIKYDPKMQETELTKQMTNFINSKMLKKGTSIDVSDIDRCHPSGCRVTNGRGNVLVKFHSYHKKKEIFYSKSNLRHIPDRIYVNEDLTKYNYKIVRALKEMKQVDQLHSYWTSNGNVYAKKLENSKPFRIHRLSDIRDRLTTVVSTDPE